MAIDPEIVHGRNPSGIAQDVAVDANGGLLASPVAPSSSNILCGSTGATGTVISIPAFRTWVGSMMMNDEIHAAPGGSGITDTLILISSGATVSPSSTIHKLFVTAPVPNSTLGTGMFGSAMIPNLIIAVGSSSANINFQTGANGNAWCSLTGYLIST